MKHYKRSYRRFQQLNLKSGCLLRSKSQRMRLSFFLHLETQFSRSPHSVLSHLISLSSVVFFSVFFDRPPYFNHGVLNKSHKFSHVKRVVPKLGIIAVSGMKFLREKSITMTTLRTTTRTSCIYTTQIPQFFPRLCPRFATSCKKLP